MLRAGILGLTVSVKSEFLAFFFQRALFLAHMDMHARVVPFFITNDIIRHETLHILCVINGLIFVLTPGSPLALPLSPTIWGEGGVRGSPPSILFRDG
jgi:hypothetical protein